MILPLRLLITFNDEFAKFFPKEGEVENIDYWECRYDASQLPQRSVRIADHEPNGWVLLRNEEHTYLLIEIGEEKKERNTWFAPDPKKVLEHLRQPSLNLPWQSLFPLIREAHRKAHPNKDDTPNLTYLEDFITKVYHAAFPLVALKSQINELNS
jgi:hypothetical protein